VPCPPQPIKPIRNLSEPAAKIRLVTGVKAAAPTAADVLIKSLRDNPDFFCITLLFINYPFN
jgi:hypothetical protein